MFEVKTYPREENDIVIRIKTTEADHSPATETPAKYHQRPNAIENPGLDEGLAIRHFGSSKNAHTLRGMALVPRIAARDSDCSLFGLKKSLIRKVNSARPTRKGRKKKISFNHD